MLDGMNAEYWIPAYLNNSEYAQQVEKWKQNPSGTKPAYLPSLFNAKDSSPVVKGDLELEYAGDMFSKIGAIRTNYPIPTSCRMYYFEITILCKGDEGYTPLDPV
jgi:hypothetical protein